MRIAGFRHGGGATRLRRGFEVLGLQQLSQMPRHASNLTARLPHIHLPSMSRLLIHRKRLTIHDRGLGSLTSVRNAL
jgi:hypothetical protein